MHPDTVTFLLAACTLLAVSSVVLLRELWQGSFSLMFWIAIVAVYLSSCIFDPFVSESLDWDYLRITVPDSIHTYTRAAWFATLFNLCYLLVRRYRYAFDGEELSQQLSRPQMNLLVAMMAIACLASIASVAMPAGLSGAFSLTYGSFGEVRISKLHMMGSYLFMIAAGSIFVTFKRRRWEAFFLLVGVALVYYGLAQQRKHAAACLTPFAIVYLRPYFRPDQFLSAVLHLAKIVLFVFIASQALVFVQVLRYEGNFFSNGLPQLLNGKVIVKFFDAVGRGQSESPARWGYYYFMEPNVTTEDQFTGRTYRRLALLPIPSALAGGVKPRDYTEVYYESVFDDLKRDQDNVQAGTHHPLIYGDSFVNFGWLGVLLGAFWALAFNGVDWLLNRSSRLVQLGMICPLGLSAMMLARGSVYNSSALCYYAFLFLLLVAHATRVWEARQHDDDDTEEAEEDAVGDLPDEDHVDQNLLDRAA